MYIHNYQIHNVLNEYRKQLSQGSAERIKRPLSAVAQDRVMLSGTVQRQSIIDQVSADIVERIRHANTLKSEDSPLEVRGQATEHQMPENGGHESEFTYTLIDEYNRKITNKLPVQNLTPLSRLSKSGQGDAQGIAADTAVMDKRSFGIS